MKISKGFVYILASKRNGTLYVGVTNNPLRRIAEHKAGINPCFTQHYGIKTLVYFETFEDFSQAITREKQLKRWRRDWKIALIERDNPQWQDLSESIGLTPEYIQMVIDEYTLSPYLHTSSRTPSHPALDAGSRTHKQKGTWIPAQGRDDAKE